MAYKMRAFARDANGNVIMLLPETIAEKVMCQISDDPPVFIPLDEVMNDHADEINDLKLTIPELIRNDLAQNRELNTLKAEIGTAVLINTLSYPFNNSIKTVSLIKTRDTTDYLVDIETVTATGGGVGRFVVTDKLLNGFKIAYTGGAASVNVKYTVRGGFM